MAENCVNCLAYNWPTEDVSVLRCSNCKSMDYCSPECQKEHWKKVHKKQCKTLAGQVEVPASTHLPKSCPGCKEEQELGMESINSQDCPAWGCMVGPGVERVPKINGKFPSAIESGEMSRKFTTKAEQTLFVMQQIVNKMMRTNSRLFKECRAEMTDLAELLAEKRMELLSMHHHYPVKMVENLLLAVGEDHEFMDAVFSSISTLRNNLDPSAGDPFLAIETLKLLAGFLSDSEMHIYHKNFEKPCMEDDLPSVEIRELVFELGSSTKFEEIWGSVLEALKTGLVHHHILLDILCGGNREQECSQCHKSVITERVLIPFIDESQFEKPFITLRGMVFSCTAKDCQVASKGVAENLRNQVWLAMNLKVASFGVENMCNNCFMFSRSVHRCSQCMTKVYCSGECQLEDWKIHEKICKEGEVARKVKKGKLGREDAVKEEVDKLKAEIENDWNDYPAVMRMYRNIFEKMK